MSENGVSEAGPPSPDAAAAKSDVWQLFDGVFKQLMKLSDLALVSFLNSLFGLALPLDSRVDRLESEQIDGGFKRQRADAVLRAGEAWFHLEAQLRADGEIAVRMFSYGFGIGLQRRAREAEAGGKRRHRGASSLGPGAVFGVGGGGTGGLAVGFPRRFAARLSDRGSPVV
ncbi:MAG: hypothetical protein LBH76_04210 [Propionibacteriaceae bacterium]|nr:hypothetical protein [Propionibacteriaceae bacterium]